MIKGAPKRAFPYALEDDLVNPVEQQTIFWIRPKTGHDANRTLARYSQCGRDGRKGYRELNVVKLDAADIEEFTNIVEKVERYCFSEVYKDKYWANKDGVLQETPVTTESAAVIADICRDLSSDHLLEIIEVANNMSKLGEYEKKYLSSSSTSAAGVQQ